VAHAGAAILLALAACSLFSLAAFVQQQASGGMPRRSGGLAGLHELMLGLVRSPTWGLGAVVNFLGFLLQAVALERGSVSLVQPIMPTQLLFAVGFAAWSARSWPGIADWVCSGLVCAGVALVLVSENGHPTEPAPERVLFVAGAAAVAIVVLLAVAHRRTPRVAAGATACAAGFCFATTSVFLKLVADRVAAHGVEGIADPATIGLVCTTTVGTVLAQAAFAAGPLPWAVAAMTIVNPVAGYAAGCLAFGGTPPSLPVGLTASALLVVGVVGLVRSRSAHGWSPTADHREVVA